MKVGVIVTTVNVTDDGRIEGYLTVKEFAEKYNRTDCAIRQEIQRKTLHPLTIGSGPDRVHYFPKDYVYEPPKRGRPRREG